MSDLDDIQRRITDCSTYNFGMRNADKLAHEDAPYLLALVREQQARIERVEGLVGIFEAQKGHLVGWVAARLRAALAVSEPTP